jgi:hypothetical protein
MSNRMPKSKVILESPDGRILFAVMVERWNPSLYRGLGGWEPERTAENPRGIIYMHAKDSVECRATFLNANFWRGRRIAAGSHAVAPAIGFTVLDNHGDRLIA